MASPSGILPALDCGAAGVVVPHVRSARAARNFTSAARYRGGTRGFTASTRAGRYGSVPMWDHVDSADAQTTVIAMIEDPEALDAIDEIAAVEGIDGLFIGRTDLAVAIDAPSPDAQE